MSECTITLPSVHAAIEHGILIVCENDSGSSDNVGMTLKDARALARWLLAVTSDS